MKVALYCRVSKEEQIPENQEFELSDYAKNRDFEIYKTYTDKISGVKDSRPALNELMTDARNKCFDAVIVWKLDRLGRSLQHLIQIIQEWKNLNIDFICKTEPIDTTSASGELIFHIFGAIAQFERQLITERINLGLDRARKQGKHIGRPKGKKILRLEENQGIIKDGVKNHLHQKTKILIGDKMQSKKPDGFLSNHCDSDSIALFDAIGGNNQKKWKLLKHIFRNGDEKLKLLLQRYKDYLCGEYNSRNTQADYFCHAKQFLEITNNKINKNTITKYKAYLNKKYKNKNTRNKKIIATNMFLDWLGKSQYRMKNIGWEHPVKPTLKDEEISKILETAYNDPELYLITLLIWEGCLRDETIINLKITDRIENKLYIKYSKTGNKSIILSPRMIEAWDKYLSIRPEPKPDYREYLFINPYRGNKGEKFQRILPIIKRIKKLGKKCGIKIDITPYTIRRTSGTLRQDKFSEFFAGDVKIVQRMFNHKDVRTTLRYDQRTDNDVERYLESIYNNKQAKYKPNQPTYKEGL